MSRKTYDVCIALIGDDHRPDPTGFDTCDIRVWLLEEFGLEYTAPLGSDTQRDCWVHDRVTIHTFNPSILYAIFFKFTNVEDAVYCKTRWGHFSIPDKAALEILAVEEEWERLNEEKD